MNHDDIQAALNHQQQLEQQEQEEKHFSFVSYCDYIAHRIKETMNGPDPRDIIVGAGSIKWDLGANGEFVSTKKHLFVVDRNRKSYKITVEEI
jgi:hypothetical protein